MIDRLCVYASIVVLAFNNVSSVSSNSISGNNSTTIVEKDIETEVEEEELTEESDYEEYEEEEEETSTEIEDVGDIDLDEYLDVTDLSTVYEPRVKSAGDINIDDSRFSSTCIRLNTQAYEITEDIVNLDHLDRCVGVSETNLGISYRKMMNPLIPMAMSVCETGMWADKRYTWAPVVYSKLLSQAGVDMDMLNINTVDEDMYIVNGLKKYLGCGSNCTAPDGSHYHEHGLNDNDSLGPLQVLRHYVESTKGMYFDCGASVIDLARWDDSVTYYFHKQAEAFSARGTYGSSKTIDNPLELVALASVAHGTGSAFLVAKSSDSYAGSFWHNADSVFSYCDAITTDEAVPILKAYVDRWYASIDTLTNFALAGQKISTSEMDSMLSQIGVNKSAYASKFGHKQYYPIKAVLNYMCLDKLYSSGAE